MRPSPARALALSFLAAAAAVLPVLGPAPLAASESETAYLRGLVHERFGRPADALAFYREAAALDPSSRFLQETLSSLCLGLSRLDEALAAAEAAVLLAPKDPLVYILRGRVRLARNERDAAAGDFDRALAVEPAHAEALLYAAYLRSSADPAGALPFLQRYLKENPGSVDALARIAQLQETLGRRAEAEASWRKAAERDSSDPRIHAALGRLAEARGDREAAVAAYGAARFLAPDDLDVLIPLGENLHRLGRRAEAEEALGRAAQLDPANASARIGLAMIAEDAQDWDGAARHLAVAVEGTEIEAVWLRLAYVQSMGGRPKEALKTLRRLLKRDPRNAEAFMLMGLAQEDLGSPRRALKMFLHAIALDPSRAEAQFHAGAAWDALGRFDRAEPHMKETIALSPRHAAALNFLGFSWADRGVRLEEALGLIRRALKEDPDNPSYLDSLGWCLFKLGRTAEAEGILARAARLDQSAEVWEHAGDALQALGRADEAARAWEEGLLQDPRRKSLRRRLGPRADRFTLGPLTAARAALKRVEADFIQLRGAAGAVEVTARRGPAALSADGVFYYRKPGEFRLEVLDPLGVPQALVWAGPAGVTVRPEEAGAAVPPGAREGLLLLGELLSGEVTKRFDDAAVRVVRRGSALLYRGPAGELEIDGRSKALTRLEAGGVVLSLGEPLEREGLRWPRLIRWESRRDRTSVTLTFRAPRLNPPLDDALFSPPAARP